MFSQKLTDRFWRKSAPSPNGCLLWVGAKTAKGYGNFRVSDKYYRAHRLAWQLENGPIPDGMMICHRCDTRDCVNPEHMFLGTAADNNRDTRDKGRTNWSRGDDHYMRRRMFECR